MDLWERFDGTSQIKYMCVRAHTHTHTQVYVCARVCFNMNIYINIHILLPKWMLCAVHMVFSTPEISVSLSHLVSDNYGTHSLMTS